jgi:colicin import membrane protein
MKEPSLQKTTALSLALHISFLFIAFLLLRQSSQYLMPSYTVSLVGPEVLKGKESRKSLKSASGGSETLRDTSVKEGVPKEFVKKRAKEEELLEEKISAIEAKKRVERIVRLRSMISLQGSSSKKEISETPSTHTGEGSLFDDYYTKIKNEIWQQWVYPGTGQKDLETIISIRIMKDGTISLQKIEKSSGNPLFDKSAIKALTKANPLSPPPYEMEIGVRFYP